MRYEWDPAKNEWHKNERGISFEQVIFHLSQGNLWKIAKHPNQKKYPGQKIYFVEIDNYIYIVPFAEESDHHLLKTIIPSRKATRLFNKEQEQKNENR